MEENGGEKGKVVTAIGGTFGHVTTVPHFPPLTLLKKKLVNGYDAKSQSTVIPRSGHFNPFS